jgi:asparagine synthase (glutamine-hydrolysing)
MSRPHATPPMHVPRARTDIKLGPGWGWTRHQVEGADIHIRGYVFDGPRTLITEAAATHAARLIGSPSSDADLQRRLYGLAGHFAIVAAWPDRVIATVDRIRSIPLLYSIKDDRVVIDDRGRRLRDRLDLARRDIEPAQALAVAMSGYSIGGATLYKGLCQLRAGEALVADDRGPRPLRWFVYDAWRAESKAKPDRELSDLHRYMMERLAASAAGRPIAVPLSAGLDSRMIASGLKAIGYRHVKLFSYGRPGNHEATTARLIAERLGYPWTFVPFSTAGQRAMFADKEHERLLWNEADTCGGIPFEQDWTAISHLRATGWLPSDVIVVNGQSGDFITGNHAPVQLIDAEAGAAVDLRRQQVTSALIAKHYRLWKSIADDRSDGIIARLLVAEAEAAGASFQGGEAAHGIYEMVEYQDRQAKYVVSGQRNYDALGIEWRLPLWDDDYVLFWRRASGALKRGQSLYRRVLTADNWGGVWHGLPVNAKTIRPRWIIPARLVAKAAFAGSTRDSWHDFERRAFQWWMDPLRISAVVPYRKALLSKAGARHAVSWIAERYLAQHGLTVEEAFRLAVAGGR